MDVRLPVDLPKLEVAVLRTKFAVKWCDIEIWPLQTAVYYKSIA